VRLIRKQFSPTVPRLPLILDSSSWKIPCESPDVLHALRFTPLPPIFHLVVSGETNRGLPETPESDIHDRMPLILGAERFDLRLILSTTQPRPTTGCRALTRISPAVLRETETRTNRLLPTANEGIIPALGTRRVRGNNLCLPSLPGPTFHFIQALLGVQRWLNARREPSAHWPPLRRCLSHFWP
jgi:hypothetical protein